VHLCPWLPDRFDLAIELILKRENRPVQILSYAIAKVAGDDRYFQQVSHAGYSYFSGSLVCLH
jgi:hypothetical protein